MKSPDIVTTLKDQERGITYHVVAFRALSRQELLTAVRYYLSTVKKNPKRGTVIRIITVIQ